ncbi:MAG: FHA domain-containing protein [Blastocatellia bacterium]
MRLDKRRAENYARGAFIDSSLVFTMIEPDSQSTEEYAYLTGLSGEMAGRKIALGNNRIIIGRDPDQCDIVLEQPTISKRHAMIEIDQNREATLVDLGSSNGSYVNDQKINRLALKDGDRVCFGPSGAVAFTYHKGLKKSAPVAQTEQFSNDAEWMARVEAASAQAGPPATSITNLTTNNLPVLRIGRAPDNAVVLDSPGVSRYHASLEYNQNGQPVLTDLGSKNGTYINGKPVLEPRIIKPTDLIFIGGYLIRVDGRIIKRYDLSASRINALHITKQIAGKTILKDVSLAISPREFVGLMGPSGCGKTTLMDALNGLRPATSGVVYINELDLYRNFNSLRRSIGYVPQRDILHDALTVERTLYHAAKLRLPKGTPGKDVSSAVEEVIEMVDLKEHRATQFRQLSGGQQKRLSLGIELITKPSFIFLDEPTSPLDPETTENMMVLFRQLADEGRIVVMVTHKFEKFETMHQVAILTRGGRLAFYGPPREALDYFGCQSPTDIYRRISAREPDELSRAFEASPQYIKYISSRVEQSQELARATGPARTESRGAERSFGVSQWITLTRRYLEVKLKDLRNTGLLLLQAPLIALILALIVGDSRNDAKTLFIAAVISIWFGANNAVREIVAEAPIYARERLVNLKIPSYVFSKFAVLIAIALIQCALFVGILTAFGRLNGDDFLMLVLILYLTSLGGISMGLFFSALVGSTEKAMSVLPLILIPQLLLSGFLKPLDDVYVNLGTGKPKPATAAEYRRSESSKDSSSQSNRNAPAVVPEIITRYEGLGAARYASVLIIARWSVEALAHEAGIDDRKARELLPTGITVAEYEEVARGSSESAITSAYRLRILLDLAVLSGFTGLFLLLTMLALKRKDML